jgi:hypothetical protein
VSDAAGQAPTSLGEAHVRNAKRLRVKLGFVAGALYLWLADPTAPSICAGAAVAAVGVLLRGLAAGHLTKDSALTTTGPYAATRNPLYLGSIIIAAGLALAALSAWVVVMFAVMFAVVYLPVIRSEETFLAARFPEYADYCRRVPRLIPRLGALAQATRDFAWARYRRHREYSALLGTAVMLSALVLKVVLRQE